MSSNLLSELDNELYLKVKNLKKNYNYPYENIPYTIAHTLDTLTGPPQNPYSLISHQTGHKWPVHDLPGKCFYDINGKYLCKHELQPSVVKPVSEKKNVVIFKLPTLFPTKPVGKPVVKPIVKPVVKPTK